MAIASSLLQAIKKLRQACPPSLLMRFSQGSIPESLVIFFLIDKVIQCVEIIVVLFYSIGVVTFNKHCITLLVMIFFPLNFQG